MTSVLRPLFRAVVGAQYKMEDGNSVPKEYRTASTPSPQEVVVPSDPIETDKSIDEIAGKVNSSTS